jgi:hypothetical protein
MGNSPGNRGHYDGAIQPIELIEELQKQGLCGYHEANAIKYIARWRRKNGIEDLAKAIWYIERLICLEGLRSEMVYSIPRPGIRAEQRSMADTIVEIDSWAREGT